MRLPHIIVEDAEDEWGLQVVKLFTQKHLEGLLGYEDVWLRPHIDALYQTHELVVYPETSLDRGESSGWFYRIGVNTVAVGYPLSFESEHKLRKRNMTAKDVELLLCLNGWAGLRKVMDSWD